MVVVAEDFGTQLENSSAEKKVLLVAQVLTVLQAEVHQGIQAVVRQAAQATQLQAVTEDVEEELFYLGIIKKR